MGKIRGFKDYDSLSDWLYEEFRKRYNQRARFQRPFKVGFSGGTSPVGLWDRMVWSGADWQYLEIFFVDERAVKPDEELSNFKLLKDRLIEPAGINLSQVHRIRGELGAEPASRQYNELLKRLIIPSGLDLIVAGIGEDGHVASIFPLSPVIKDRENLALASYDGPLVPRITFTLKTFRLAREVFLILAGKKKRDALKKILDERTDTAQCPAKAVLELGNSIVLTTELS